MRSFKIAAHAKKKNHEFAHRQIQATAKNIQHIQQLKKKANTHPNLNAQLQLDVLSIQLYSHKVGNSPRGTNKRTDKKQKHNKTKNSHKEESDQNTRVDRESNTHGHIQLHILAERSTIKKNVLHNTSWVTLPLFV